MRVLTLLLLALLRASVCEATVLMWANGGTYQDVLIERAPSASGAFAVIKINPGSLNSYEDTAGAVGNCWRVKGRAVMDGQLRDSAYSNVSCLKASVGNMPALTVVSLTIPDPPPAVVASYSFSEGSGTTTADGSGNNNRGALNGAAWTNAGKFGNALSFSGAQWVQVPDSSSLDLTTGITLAAWVYPTAAPTNWSTILMKQGGAEYAYGLYAGGSSANNRPRFVLEGNGSNRQAIGTAALTLNTWSHVAGTYDSLTLRLYVNGVLISSLAYAGAAVTSNQPLAIGRNLAWQEFFTGRLDEVKVYNRALTVSEIQAVMNTQ